MPGMGQVLLGMADDMAEAKFLLAEMRKCGIVAELRPPQRLGCGCTPEIWVDEADLARANELVHEVTAVEEPSQTPWTCPNCLEEIEGQF